MKILVIGFLEFTPNSQRGINVITSALAESGLDVSFLTFPSYAWDLFSKKRRDLITGKNIRINDDNSVYNFTRVVTIPYSTSKIPPLIKFRLLRIFESAHTKKFARHFNNYDMIVLESGKGVFFERYLTKPKLIYRQSDPVEFGLDKDLADYERRVIKKADLTLVANRVILDKYKLLHPDLIPRMKVWENGFFVPKHDFNGNPFNTKPNAIYFGLFPINWDALSKLATETPNLSIHIFGPFKRPKGVPQNVILHGFQPHEKVNRFLKYSDLFLLPYKDIPNRLEITDKTSKILLAMHYCLPIVAAPFSYSERLKKFDIISTKSIDEFVREVQKILSSPRKKRYSLDLSAYSIENRKREFLQIINDFSLL
jgi:hypothetical protein